MLLSECQVPRRSRRESLQVLSIWIQYFFFCFQVLLGASCREIYQSKICGRGKLAVWGAIPASREMLDRRWANVVTYVGATSANDGGTTWICPSVQRWHNVVTSSTMTLCQRFANVITYFILLYLMVGTTFAHCLYEWWAKHWHNFNIAHRLSTITIEIISFIWKAVA